jgi:hypothetical protein
MRLTLNAPSMLTRILMLACFVALGSCSERRDSDSAENSRDATPAGDLQVSAARLVSGGAPIRWVSKTELCVIPFTAADYPGCDKRVRTFVSASAYMGIRSGHRMPSASEPHIRCLRVSKPIDFGDSSLVSVNTIDGAAVDGMSQSTTKWVWYWSRRGVDSSKVVESPVEPYSDVQPLTDSTRC